MKKNSVLLTANEEALMNILWNSSQPLSCSEIMIQAKEMGWGDTYILNMLRTLKKKGMAEACGTIQHRTQYARQFSAVVSREQYAAKAAMATGIQKDAIGRTALALVQEMEVDEDLMQELKAVLQKIEEGEKYNG